MSTPATGGLSARDHFTSLLPPLFNIWPPQHRGSRVWHPFCGCFIPVFFHHDHLAVCGRTSSPSLSGSSSFVEHVGHEKLWRNAELLCQKKAWICRMWLLLGAVLLLGTGRCLVWGSNRRRGDGVRWWTGSVRHRDRQRPTNVQQQLQPEAGRNQMFKKTSVHQFATAQLCTETLLQI